MCRSKFGFTAMMVLALLAGGPLLSPAVADTLYTAGFTGPTAPDWNLSGSASLTGTGAVDPLNNGWLRLTPSTGTQAGAALCTTPISSSAGIQVTFQYNIWDCSNPPADGITLDIINANHAPTKPGATGGAIGYAQNTSTAGIVGGMLGIALDTYGNFSDYNEGRDGVSGLHPDTVSIRGPGDGTDHFTTAGASGTLDNYPELALSSKLPEGALVSNAAATVRPAEYGTCTINFDMSDIADGNAWVGVKLTGPNGNTYTPITSFNAGPALFNYFGAGKVPTDFDLAFTGGTGGDNEYNEVRYLGVSNSVPDASFISAPEPGLLPAALALLGLGGLCLCARRQPIYCSLKN